MQKTKRITQEMRTQFWKHNLNPITGHPRPKVPGGERMGLDSLSVNKPSRNKYSN